MLLVTDQASKGQGHLLSCSGQLKTNAHFLFSVFNTVIKGIHFIPYVGAIFKSNLLKLGLSKMMQLRISVLGLNVCWFQRGRVKIQIWWCSVLKERSGVEVIKTVLLGSEAFLIRHILHPTRRSNPIQPSTFSTTVLHPSMTFD